MNKWLAVAGVEGDVFEFVAQPYPISPEEFDVIRGAAKKHGTTDLVVIASPEGFMVTPREYAIRTAPPVLTKDLEERPTPPAALVESKPGHTWIWFLQILYKVPSLGGKGGVQVNMLPVDFSESADSPG